MKSFYKKIQPYLIFFIIFIIFIIMAAPFCSSIAYSAILFCSDTLINKSNQLDGETVHFQGEIVGDIMERGTYGWINVYDGSQAIGVYCDMKMVKSIQFAGDYKHTGDTVELRGIFHKSCQQHGGELDIHAEQVRIIKTGGRRSHPLSNPKVYLAVALLLCTALVLWLYTCRKKIST